MEERHTLLLPDWVWVQIDRLAKKRGCSANDLLAGQSRRMIAHPDFLHRVEEKVGEIMRLRHAGQADADAWPKDPLDAPAVSLRMSLYFEDLIENHILEMNEERLALWDIETQRTGKSIEELVRDRGFGQPGEGDHKKRDSA